MNYTIDTLPLTAEAYEAVLPKMSREPEGAAAACVLALNIITHDEHQGVDSLKTMNPEISYSSIQLAVSQLRSKSYMLRSYFSGTSPENDYTIPEKMEMIFTTNRYSGSKEEGKIKLFIACSGAASPRPVTLKKRSDSSWYAHEWSSLVVGVRSPEKKPD